MQNFVFYNPVKILFGRDTLPEIGRETAYYGKKVLLVYGKGSIRKNGIYHRVIRSLDEQDIRPIEHGGVQSNPLLHHVQQGILSAKKHKVDTIVAVGGGSVIDTAKAISAGALVEHNVWKFFTGKKSIKQTLPVISVLTLAGSGSEMNSAMVITNDDKDQKFGFANKFLFPKVSILDPTSTFSVPSDYTAFGAVDAIAHLLEFYFTSQDSDTPIQDRLAEGLVKTILDSCERVLRDPEDYHGRANLMWCASLALNGLTGAGLGKVGFPMHMIEHSLSALYDTPHGAGLSVVVPGWLTYQSRIKPDKFARFAEQVFQIDRGNQVEKAADGIKQLKAWFKKAGCPTRLNEIGTPVSDLPKIAENALDLGKIWRMGDYDQAKIEEILQLCV